MKKSNSKLNDTLKLAALGALGYMANNVFSSLKPSIVSAIKTKTAYSISLDKYSRRDYYAKVKEYLIDKFPQLKRFGKMSEFAEYDDGIELGMAIDISVGSYVFYLDKCVWKIDIHNEESKFQNSPNTVMDILLTGCNSKKYYNEIVSIIRTPSEELYPNNNLYVSFIDGDGRTSYAIQKVSIDDDIFTKYNDEIKIILDEFVSSRDYYKEKNIYHKIGFLFDGEPGTGKTKMAMAIASYLGYELYIVRTNTINQSIMRELRCAKRKVILFEEIDCTNGIDRKQKPRNAVDFSKDPNIDRSLYETFGINTLSNLLQILDGVVSPTDCVFIGTTNYMDKLDDALLRKSRFDHIYTFSNMDRSLAKKMCDKFGVDINDVMKEDELEINPTELQYRCIRFHDKK